MTERARSTEWDALAGRMTEPQFQEQIALYKRRENLELIEAWAPGDVRRVLKTDLFEEAFGQDTLIDALARIYPSVVGMDIARIAVATARVREPLAAYVAADAYALPFRPQSFDLIVSISTLDHLPPALFPKALGELCRALRPGGSLVLTLDSRHNPLHVLSNRLRRRRGMIYAERCFKVADVMTALAGQRVEVAAVTAIYHIPFPMNFLAKKVRAVVGAPADPWIRRVIGACRRLGRLRTRFFTGRYIALRIVKPAGAPAQRQQLSYLPRT